jgi:hypothetical protein
MLRGPFEQPLDPFVGDLGEGELGAHVRANVGPVAAGDEEALGVGVAAAALHPDLAGA